MKNRMMIKKWLMMLAGIAIWVTGMAQIEVCGSTEAQYEFRSRTLQNKTYIKQGLTRLRGVVEYVPVKYHLVADSDGDGRVREEDVLDQHCTLNEHYADQEIQFFLNDGFNNIDNTTVYENPGSFSAQIRMNSERDDNAMNVYICENAGSTGNLITNGFYNPAGDWVVMRKGVIGANISTLTHEFGHFFSLNHPFVGWEASETGWDPSVHGNPVTSTLSPGGVPNELVDGSNGDSAGDMVADTPADYLFGFSTSGCNFTGGCRDRNGDLLDPMENNFMQWGYSCNNEAFTQGQKDIIFADLTMNSERAYLDNNYTPESTEITDVPSPAPPFSLSTSGSQTDVEFEWDEVDGATMYMVQTARNPGFTVQRQTVITSGTSVTLSGYTIGSRYFYRIRPFNAYYTCTGYAEDDFTAGENSVSVSPVNELRSLVLLPNVTFEGSSIRMQWELDQTIRAEVSVINAYGQIVAMLGQQELNAGMNYTDLPVEDLQSGLYFVRVAKGSEVSTRKFIITK